MITLKEDLGTIKKYGINRYKFEKYMLAKGLNFNQDIITEELVEQYKLSFILLMF